LKADARRIRFAGGRTAHLADLLRWSTGILSGRGVSCYRAGLVTDPAAHRTPKLPELLAPAGDWDCVRAAVENGADAVYFGLDRFNARMRARNFTEADLPALMEFLHRRGVRGYVTFNTLVFTEELADAEDYLRSVIAAGVDAAIVQDVGICRLIRRISPDFPIHGSTQLTVTSPAGVEFARSLGCGLVVLARENSIREIEAIQAAQRSPSVSGSSALPDGHGPTGTARPEPLPLEVFVHGALCVAYSGQCLTSESLGGRSANRGECAQACRMPYELVSDGKTVDLGDRRYLLSPQDLSGLEVLPDLVRAGVASLKIEGRLKSPEYVASITRVYRKALDRLAQGDPVARPDPATGEPGAIATMGTRPTDAASPRAPAPATRPGDRADPVDRYELEMAFSRGLHTGWFRGIDNQALAHARFGKKRGVYLGEVSAVGPNAVRLRLEGPLKPGDGVGFDAGRPDLPEEGGRVYGVRSLRDGMVEVSFGGGAVDFRRIEPGHRLWKTDDPELGRDLRKSFEGGGPRHTRPLRFEVHGVAGGLLTLIARDAEGNVAEAASAMPLVPAERRPLTPETLGESLGRLGGTPFHLGGVEARLEAGLILPVSELNRLRREVVARVEALRAAPRRWALLQPPPAAATGPSPSEPVRTGTTASLVGTLDTTPELIVLVRSLGQLEAALRCGVATVYCDFEDPKLYRQAVTTFHTARGCAVSPGTPGGSGIWVAPPRVFKPGEEWILRQVLSSDADGYLVRNPEHLRFFAGKRRRGDFSLNVANPLSAEWFITQHGLERVTVSYDLNAGQVASLLRAAPPAWFELTLHQHMPLFHMEHCVFCAFLSKGTDYTNCGRPCDKHVVKLRDRTGAEHPLKADSGCRNTVFNAKAQTGAESLGRFVELGARAFRVEFVDETPDQVATVIGRYRALLRGEITGQALWQELKLSSQLGVTRGQFETNEARKVFPRAS
jgi:putative protease